ncbi:FSR family fosmidomycin resistance protein-like MFS transporter [Actinomycetospora succinea]|uniref:FSR family fosmidomycin resistance protein-like MFS transporter n=1 Tax=Actinomycetospora succinea TaxID=663603 RepID=A0A4R6VPE1_9PSEU|nr:MFS transporter [Actinomycetospora succinea]TDQ65779.1 FSR family fosmidomycin resistance protein-like MFS transporter [Actinomycetospora succinea]
MSGRRRALGLAVEHGVDDLYQGAVPALVPALVAVRGWDLTRAGGIVLAATVLSSLAQPLFGLVTDRRRMPRLRILGMLLAAAGVGAVGLTDSYLATWCAVLLSGLGIAAYHPEAARAVHATGTGDRGMGWFTVGGLAGFAAGPAAVGLVVGGLGLAATPLLAVPAVVAAMLGLLPRRRPGPVTTSSEPPVLEGREDWRRFGWLTGVVVTRSIAFYGLSAFLAVHLTMRFGFGPGLAATTLGIFTGAGAVATVASSALTRRWGRTAVLRWSYVAAVPLLAATLVAPSPVLALAATGLLGAALGVPVPVHTTLGQAYLPRHLGLAASVTLGLAVSAGGLASPALGALADHRGTTVALAVLIAGPVLAAVLTLALRDPADPAARTGTPDA